MTIFIFQTLNICNYLITNRSKLEAKTKYIIKKIGFNISRKHSEKKNILPR